MKSSLRGAFLSGLVFPGLGQVTFKRYKRGAVLMLVFLGGLVAMTVQAVQHALSIVEKIELRGGAIDLGSLVNAVTQSNSTSGSLVYNLALFLITSCWIVATVDAYRIGREIDTGEQ